MRSAKQPAVYILASRPLGTLYIGVTSSLGKRVWQHKSNLLPGFTGRHDVHRLVYYELHGDMTGAIRQETKLKRWSREWKIVLIEGANPTWRDLYGEVI